MRQNFNTLLQTIEHYKFILSDRIVLLAVSGGADSLALLHWFSHHRDTLNMRLHVATLNHGLRPEAHDDVVFVQVCADRWQVPCTIGQVNVPQIARKQGIGIEAAARRARYDFLAQTAHTIGASVILTAHHADDQSETILMHILRGAGSQGLQGMSMLGTVPNHPDLTLMRPFLHISRTEIERYCTQYNLQARIDPTNFDTDYLRNEIRHEILPRLRQINPQLDQALARLAEITRTEQDLIETVYQQDVRAYATFTERVAVALVHFQQAHPALQRRFLLDAIIYFDGEPRFEHIQHALELVSRAQVGAIAEFTGGLRLRIGYEMLYLEPIDLPLPTGEYLQLTAPCPVRIPGITSLNSRFNLVATYHQPATYDAYLAVPEGASVALRTRQSGDRFQPQGMGGRHRKLKSWLIDHKVPAFVRDAIPILTVNGTIAAIILPENWRIAEPFIVNENAQQIIYFQVSIS
ncbi:MAG: tRNA lysidine(34) synthetase TilS [Anaerolineae bacterium]